jgi:hypothetical protein
MHITCTPHNSKITCNIYKGLFQMATRNSDGSHAISSTKLSEQEN